MSAHFDTSKIETRLFINGEFVAAESGKKFKVVNPCNEEVIVEVCEADEADVNKAVAAAKEAFKLNSKWRSMPGSGRRDLMLKLVSLIERDREYLQDLESLDNGKPVSAHGQAYGTAVDLHLVIQCLRYYAGHADKITGKTIPVDGDFLTMTLHEPVGVVGQIIPWNFPLLMMAWKIGPALACGCTIVLKTSEKTPLSALHLAKLSQEAGFPPGVLNVLSGFGPSAGKALAVHPDVDKVAFTGSTAVGKLIQGYSAQGRLKRVTLELGGKSPVIVCEDADLDQAVMAAHVGLFLNNGQCCCAGSRIFVDEKVYDKFIAKAVELSKSLKLGDGFQNPEVNQGPIVDDIQFKKVMSYIEEGKKDGAKCVVGGDREGTKGYFVQPTIFADVTDDMKIAKEEIFGPVMSVFKFKTLDEVIERANETAYGLAASVMTRDIGRAIRLAKSIRAGTVWINCHNAFDAAQPFGGFKDSGLGRELGEYALTNYTEVKSLVIPIDK